MKLRKDAQFNLMSSVAQALVWKPRLFDACFKVLGPNLYFIPFGITNHIEKAFIFNKN